MIVLVLHAFLGCCLTVTEDNEANDLGHGFIVWILHLDVSIGTVAKCFTEKQAQGGHRQRLYPVTYERLLLLEKNQFTGILPAIVEYWAGELLVSRPDGIVLEAMQNPSNGEI